MLVPYAFPVAPDGHRCGNSCDACHKIDAVTVRDTVTGGIYCSETCHARDRMPLTTGFTAITKEALSVGWPTSYRRDLTLHDRRELSRHEEGDPFLWVLRELGTHLVFPGAGDVSCETIARSVISTWGDRCRCYHFDGYALREVTSEAAVDVARRWDRAAKAKRAA